MFKTEQTTCITLLRNPQGYACTVQYMCICSYMCYLQLTIIPSLCADQSMLPGGPLELSISPPKATSPSITSVHFAGLEDSSETNSSDIRNSSEPPDNKLETQEEEDEEFVMVEDKWEEKRSVVEDRIGLEEIEGKEESSQVLQDKETVVDFNITTQVLESRTDDSKSNEEALKYGDGNEFIDSDSKDKTGHVESDQETDEELDIGDVDSTRIEKSEAKEAAGAINPLGESFEGESFENKSSGNDDSISNYEPDKDHLSSSLMTNDTSTSDGELIMRENGFESEEIDENNTSTEAQHDQDRSSEESVHSLHVTEDSNDSDRVLPDINTDNPQPAKEMDSGKVGELEDSIPMTQSSDSVDRPDLLVGLSLSDDEDDVSNIKYTHRVDAHRAAHFISIAEEEVTESVFWDVHMYFILCLFQVEEMWTNHVFNLSRSKSPSQAVNTFYLFHRLFTVSEIRTFNNELDITFII